MDQLIRPNEVELADDLTFVEAFVKSVDGKAHHLITKEILMLKVVWQNQEVGTTTWQTEARMQERYPELLGEI